MSMIGAQSRSMGKNVPSDVLVAATKDPEAFEAKLKRYEDVRAEAQEAQNGQRQLIAEARAEAQKVLDARANFEREKTEQLTAIAEASSALTERKHDLNNREQHLRLEQAQFAKDRAALARDRDAFAKRVRQTEQEHTERSAGLADLAARLEESREALERQQTAHLERSENLRRLIEPLARFLGS